MYCTQQDKDGADVHKNPGLQRYLGAQLSHVSAEPLFALPGLPLKSMEASPLHVPVALGTSVHTSHTTAEP